MLHGLRHHFLTMHAVAGTLAPILMRLATHKDLATTQRYIDIADADLLATADKTESLIEQQLSIVPPNSQKDSLLRAFLQTTGAVQSASTN